jgi:hypothetical protein
MWHSKIHSLEEKRKYGEGIRDLNRLEVYYLSNILGCNGWKWMEGAGSAVCTSRQGITNIHESGFSINTGTMENQVGVFWVVTLCSVGA